MNEINEILRLLKESGLMKEIQKLNSIQIEDLEKLIKEDRKQILSDVIQEMETLFKKLKDINHPRARELEEMLNEERDYFFKTLNSMPPSD